MKSFGSADYTILCHSLLLCAVFFPFARCTRGPMYNAGGTALLQVPTLQKPLLLQGFLAHLLRCQLLLSLLAPQVRPVLSCIWAAKRVKLCPFLPVHAICIRLFMPKPFVVCAEVSVARSSCNKSSLDLSFQSRDFAREVGFRPNWYMYH